MFVRALWPLWGTPCTLPLAGVGAGESRGVYRKTLPDSAFLATLPVPQNRAWWRDASLYRRARCQRGGEMPFDTVEGGLGSE